MPISSYFGGHGSKVMAEMKRKHGERGESVFYATANKKKQKPKPKRKPPAYSKGYLKAY